MTRMKPLLYLIGLLFTCSLHAQQPKTGPNFNFHTPAEWRGEVIQLPPGFAPTLAWKGVENIRFAPGMFKPETEDFFSYLLVFLLDKDADASDAAMSKQVLTYYQGLAQAVAGRKMPDLDTSTFKLKLDTPSGDPLDPPAGSKGKDTTFWTGTLDWIEPFATRKAQTLHFEVHRWQHGEQTALYFTVSPQKPDHTIWETMRKLRAKFTFEEK